MKTNLITSWKACALTAALIGFGQWNVPGLITGPYTADPNTLHLWHMDASGVPVPDAVATGGTNMVGLLNTASLGNPSFAGFGTALSTIGSGQDSTTQRGPLLTPSTASPTPGNITTTIANTSNGAFTMEALVWIGFDPTKNFGPTAYGGNGRTTPLNILTGESSASANRIFQFRIFGIGNVVTTGVTNARPGADV